MRVWAIWAQDQNPPAELLFPPKTILPYKGVRSASQAIIPQGWPAFLTDTQICEYYYRFRKFVFTFSYGLNGTDPDGNSYVIGGSGTALLLSDQSVFDNEITLIRDYSLTGGAQGGFTGPYSGSQTTTVTPTAAPPFTETVAISGDVQFYVGQATFPAFPFPTPVTPYYYRTDTNLWLPAMNTFADLGGSGIFNPLFSAIPSPPVGAEEVLSAQTCLINGAIPLTIQTVIFNYLGYTSFSMTIEPIEWWPYRDREGQNPVWNTLTGARLLPNTVPMD